MPTQWTLSDEETAEILILLGATPSDAQWAIGRAETAGYHRSSPGSWHVQVDHAGDARFTVTVHAKRKVTP